MWPSPRDLSRRTFRFLLQAWVSISHHKVVQISQNLLYFLPESWAPRRHLHRRTWGRGRGWCGRRRGTWAAGRSGSSYRPESASPTTKWSKFPRIYCISYLNHELHVDTCIEELEVGVEADVAVASGLEPEDVQVPLVSLCQHLAPALLHAFQLLTLQVKYNEWMNECLKAHQHKAKEEDVE